MMANTEYHIAAVPAEVSLWVPPGKDVCTSKVLRCHKALGPAHTHTQPGFILRHRSGPLGSEPLRVALSLVWRLVSTLVIEADLKIKTDWKNVNFFGIPVSFLR